MERLKQKEKRTGRVSAELNPILDFNGQNTRSCLVSPLLLEAGIGLIKSKGLKSAALERLLMEEMRVAAAAASPSGRLLEQQLDSQWRFLQFRRATNENKCMQIQQFCTKSRLYGGCLASDILANPS